MRISALEPVVAVIAFAAFPVLQLAAVNAGQVPPTEGWRALLISILLALLALGVARLAVGQSVTAALLVCGLLVLFYSYGQVYDQLRSLSADGLGLGRHRYLLLAWAVLAAAWVWLVLKHAQRSWLHSTMIVGLMLLALPVLRLLLSGGSTWLAAGAAAEREQVAKPRPAATYPDIYYVILDAYASDEVLRDFYGLDNDHFRAALEARGFYVAADARANYSQTAQSLASSLNLTYLDELARTQSSDSVNRAPLHEMVQHSRVRQTLEGLGYQTIAFETSYPPTELRDADRFLEPPYRELAQTAGAGLHLPLEEFETLLLETTLLRPALDAADWQQANARGLISYLYQKHRFQVEFTLGSLAEAGQAEGPQFVFAHVVSPHPPFVFGALGEEVIPSRPFSRQDVGCCGHKEYVERYPDQVTYLNRLILAAVDDILERSTTPPIIILQGDHGPAGFMDSQAPLESNMRERLSILNAYLIPEDARQALYPAISPVNSFRVILNNLLGESQPLLPDRSYFAPGDLPYMLTDVTERSRSE